MASGYREEYVYNLDGSLKSAVNDAVSYHYEYTPSLKLKSKRANGKPVLNYRYDRDGNLIELKDILGKVTTYKYDELGRLSEVWDASQKEASYTYNLDNTIASICYGNGTTVEYSYDEDKNITSIVSRNKDGEEIISHKYSYDNNGNQIERIENGKVTSFFYDKLNRLEKVVYPDMEETFKYDFAGNRILRIKGNIKEEYSYDKRNRLVEKVEGGVHTLYKYDSHGNLIQESGRSGVTKYTYDCFNRTTSVQSATGGFIKNVYDPESLRYEVQENGNISRFVFSGREIVSELDDGWSLKHSTIRGHELLAHKEVTGKSYYYVNNAHGDVLGLLDNAGAMVNRYQYDAFGNTVEAVENVKNRFRYAGEQYDQVTGQYYLRARFYNPVVGRFTQEDTYRGDGLNLYAYVSNNPIKYVDPSGYNACSKKSDTWEPDDNIPERKLLTGEEWYQYFREKYGAENVKGSAYNLPSNELQTAIDSIHAAAYGGSAGGTFRNHGGENPLTLTVTHKGDIILSAKNSKPLDDAIAKAYELFGEENVTVVSGKGKHYDARGKQLNEGALVKHSEVRGIQQVKIMNGTAEGAKQFCSHYSCRSCAEIQSLEGVMNYTGLAEDHDGKISRNYSNPLY